MTLQTCLRYYEEAKRKGNQSDMEYWKKRAEAKGGSVEAEVKEEETKKGKK